MHQILSPWNNERTAADSPAAMFALFLVTLLAATRGSAERVPVLVELFTSEGCSSCPPADALLARLAATQPVPGVEIIALSEHVDYWNRLGWKDPFSDARFSVRQEEYASAFGTGNIYTPQMVIDGQAEFVGGDQGRAIREIQRAAQAVKAHVKLAWPAPGTLRVDVTGVPGGGPAEVLLAITEGGLAVDVRRGENGGRRLAHTAVVRRLSKLGRVEDHSAAFMVSVPVTVESAWRLDQLRAVVFVQETRRKRILGAASVGF